MPDYPAILEQGLRDREPLVALAGRRPRVQHRPPARLRNWLELMPPQLVAPAEVVTAPVIRVALVA
jgi:hypothetical protein